MKIYDYPNRTYTQVYVNGKVIFTHRYVWEQANGKIPKGMCIHHINGNAKDNALSNLALVTQKQNMEKPDRMGKGWIKSTAVKGRPYRAQRVLYGKPKHLGFFGTMCGAIMATRMAWLTQ